MRATRQARDETAETFWQAGRTMGEGAVLKRRTVKQQSGVPKSCDNQSAILVKSECDFGKSECDFVKISQWCCENQPLILVKSECDFGKVEVWLWYGRNVIL